MNPRGKSKEKIGKAKTKRPYTRSISRKLRTIESAFTSVSLQPRIHLNRVNSGYSSKSQSPTSPLPPTPSIRTSEPVKSVSNASNYNTLFKDLHSASIKQYFSVQKNKSETVNRSKYVPVINLTSAKETCTVETDIGNPQEGQQGNNLLVSPPQISADASASQCCPAISTDDDEHFYDYDELLKMLIEPLLSSDEEDCVEVEVLAIDN